MTRVGGKVQLGVRSGGEVGGETAGGDPLAELKQAAEQEAQSDPARAQAHRAGHQILEAFAKIMHGLAGAAAVEAVHPSLKEDARVTAAVRDDLEELGYDTGNTDQSLSAALKKYQSDSGLEDTGALDMETLMSMVESMLKRKNSGAAAPQRRNSSWSSGRSGGTPGVANNPVSNQGYQSPSGNYETAPAARGDGARPSTGPAPNGRVDLSTPEGQEVFRQAARLAGVPEEWATSPALRSLVNHESGGIVGRLNYTYGNRDPASVHAELKSGRISARSSATGLGQLLLSNVDKYYPNGRAGIGDPVQEAAGMLAYIKDRYGSPDVAWGNHSANPRRHQGVPRIYRAEGY
jgi:Putative peptidoglycan binding domain